MAYGKRRLTHSVPLAILCTFGNIVRSPIVIAWILSIGGLVTLTERKNGFLLAVPILNRKVETVNRAILHAYASIPKRLRRTLTLDNGLEFAGFKTLERELGIKVYFADPYSPWQRGSNENTNGLIRQYLPKGSDLTQLTQDYLNIITQKLNNRPRKKLNYRTPAQLMGVALGL